MTKQDLAINTQAGATMSSVEIAKLTGKRHDNVVRDIRNMLERLGEGHGIHLLERTYTSRSNTTQPELVLGFDGVLMFLSGCAASIRQPVITLVAQKVVEHQKVMDALRLFDLSELPGEMFLYVAKNKGTGNFKVGISRNPEERVKALQVGCDGELQLIATVSAKNGYQSEAQAHARLSNSLVHGEWFSATQEEVLEASR